MFVVIHLETDERRFLTNDVTYVDCYFQQCELKN